MTTDPEDATPLRAHELVVHVFVAAGSVADHAYYLDLWQRCAERYGMAAGLPAYPSDPPAEPPAVDERSEVLAVRSRRGDDGLWQMVARRIHDVLVLSMVAAPATGATWADLDEAWRSVRTRGVLGSVRILQAQLDGEGEQIDLAALGPAVAGQSAYSGAWSTTGVLLPQPPLGPFGVWEVMDTPAGFERDGRAHRCVVVVAPAGRDAQLSAWTWTRGDEPLTPFALYLLHAAKIRYVLRVRAANQGTALRRSATALVERLLPALDAGCVEPGEEEATATALVGLRAAHVRLTRIAGWLHGMRTTVRIGARNMARHAGAVTGGLFADDLHVAEWLDRQIDNDLAYLEPLLPTVRSMLDAAAAVVPAGPVRRPGPLTGEQKRALRLALSSAYPTYDDLEMLVDEELDIRLADIAQPGPVPTVVHKIIGWAEQYGRLDDLIRGGTAGNPGNPALQELTASRLLER